MTNCSTPLFLLGVVVRQKFASVPAALERQATPFGSLNRKST